jgi:hypothetical protein
LKEFVMSTKTRTERSEHQTLLHSWLPRGTYQQMQQCAGELGLSVSAFARIALVVGAASITESSRRGSLTPKAMKEASALMSESVGGGDRNKS